MSLLSQETAAMSREELTALTKVSSKIRNAGVHKVEIIDAVEIGGDKPRIKVDFKAQSGESADLTLWLLQKNKETGVEETSKRTLKSMGILAKAVGFEDLGKVAGKTKEITLDYKSGPQAAERFMALIGKELYITTTTEIAADQKDASKVWVNQVVHPTNFYDIKKRNSIEIASDMEEGECFEVAVEEAQSKVEISYRDRANKACQRKLKELQSKARLANLDSEDTIEVEDEIVDAAGI